MNDYTQRRLELLEHITDQHNAIDITRIPDNYYEQIKTLISTSIAQAVAEERERVVGEIEKIYSISDTQQDSCDNFKKKVLDTLSSLEPLSTNKE